MKCTVPEISWHNREPVLSVDFQYGSDGKIQRLATGGTDSHVLIWHVSYDESDLVKIDFASDLTRHQKAVNIVRFSPNGTILASADDEAAIITWKLGENNDLFCDSDAENKENWVMLKLLRGHLEDIYDLSWSPCSNFFITGSVDNTAIMWDVKKGKNMALLSDHKGFVQGVSWDPLNNYVATLSSDRICRIFNIANKKVVHRIQKTSMPVSKDGEVENKLLKMYHDDTLKTFCRRLTFTPDGELLITPSGALDLEDGKTTNATYIFSRMQLSKPTVYLPTKNKYTIAVRCCPILFNLRPIPREGIEESENMKPWQKYATIFSLPYRMVFAVATQDSIIFYDTQQPSPIGHVSNCHYTRLSDISWSKDGRILITSSTDGYCSLITFDEGELGTPYETNIPSSENANSIDQAKCDNKSAVSHQSMEPVKESSKLETQKKVDEVCVDHKPKQILQKKTPKRVPFVTLSSPKNEKGNFAKKKIISGTEPSISNEKNSEDLDNKLSSCQLLKNLHTSVDENEVEMKCIEDESDIKLVLEPTLDDSNFQNLKLCDKKSETSTVTAKDCENSKDDLKPSNSSNTPRRIQLITLSKPAK